MTRRTEAIAAKAAVKSTYVGDSDDASDLTELNESDDATSTSEPDDNVTPDEQSQDEQEALSEGESDDEEDAESVGESDDEFKPGRPTRPKPRAKRMRISSVKKREKPKGFLSEFHTLPSDIVFEIFSLLDPIDLLNIGRTTKKWRRVLFSQQTASLIWRKSFANLPCDFPAPPEDLDLPELAALVFDENCTLCGKRCRRDLWYELRVRLCRKCTKDTLFHPKRHRCLVYDMHPKTFELLPSTIWNRWYYVPDARWMSETLFALDGAVAAGKKGAVEKRDAFVEAHLVLVKSLKETRDDISEWQLRERLWQNEMQPLWQAQRLKFIRQRLVELGYDAGELDNWLINDIAYFRNNLERPFTLTDWPSIWRNVQPTFDSKLERRRAEVREEIRSSRLTKLSDRYSLWRDDRDALLDTDMPCEAAFQTLPCIVAATEPDGPSICDEYWQQEMLPALEADIKLWRTTRIKALLDKAGVVVSADGDDAEVALEEVCWGFADKIKGRAFSPREIYDATAAGKWYRPYARRVPSMQDAVRSSVDSVYFSAGQHALLSELASHATDDQVERALQGGRCTQSDPHVELLHKKWFCPSPKCVDRPARRLGNLMVHQHLHHSQPGDDDEHNRGPDPFGGYTLASLSNLSPTPSESAVLLEEQQVRRRAASNKFGRCDLCEFGGGCRFPRNTMFWHLREAHGLEPDDEDICFF